MSTTVGACGGFEGPGAEEPLEPGTADAALNFDGEEFKGWLQVPALAGATSDPALCTDGGRAFLAFSRTTSGLLYGVADFAQGFSSWTPYNTLLPRKFGTSPACAMIFPTPTERHFITVARGSTDPLNQTDRRLFWSQGRWLAGTTANPPEMVTEWAPIDSNTYASGGSPAIVSRNDKVVITFLADNGKIHAHYKDPSQPWSDRKDGPDMPAGWTAIGTPAIAFVENWVMKYMIVVLAANSNFTQFKFYYTFFNGTSFVDAVGGTPATFEELPLATTPGTAPTVDSEPALEYESTQLATSTLYYRVGDFIYQTSGLVYDFGTNGILPIRGDVNKQFRSAPSVVGGVPYDQGLHQVLARDSSNRLWHIESQNDYLTP
ncbi:hypothetical protein WME77_02150 [Sorangium sp. So ce764]|uniref:hypothetical protein n=1 Tax=Sorangium sp. So ce764 TaxID=3133320 RepID=UPI003F633E75